VVGQLVAEVLRQTVVAGEGAVVRGCSSEAHVDAEVVAAFSAAGAASAWDTWFHCYAVAGLDARDGAADFFYYAAGFVAQYHGVLDDEVADGAVGPVVYVAAADAGVFDVDEDIVGAFDGGDGAVFEFDVVWLVQYEGEVLAIDCQVGVLGWS